MTVLVGVKCTDGVVVGADGMATSTAGPERLIQLRSDDKIVLVGDRIIAACTGSVGLAQRFHAIVRDSWTNKKLFSKPALDCVKEIAKSTINDFSSTGVMKHNHFGFGFGAMLAAPLDGAAQLIEFDTVHFQPEQKRDTMHFVSMGSGQPLSDPFLAFVSRVLWGGKAPDVRTAIFGLYWALSHTIAYAPGGVGHPIKLATLRKEKGDWVARLLGDHELQESGQHVAEIEKRIAQYPTDIISQAAASPPPSMPEIAEVRVVGAG